VRLRRYHEGAKFTKTHEGYLSIAGDDGAAFGLYFAFDGQVLVHSNSSVILKPMVAKVASSTQDFVAKCTEMAADMLRLPAQHVWVDYDQEADVLYMSFRRPQKATKTIEMDNDILVRKDGRTIVGLTILNAKAKRRMGKGTRGAFRV
jgi:uncharacterized protein YuzE